ncbi:MAG: LamG-like jellyroll fold domain-containing protein [Solirubrobacterales bacterium]
MRTMVVSLALVVCLAGGIANADIKNGLVGYYPLDEGAGDVAHDMSGSGHDGTLYNGVTWLSPAYQGNGVSSDGTAASRIALGTWNPAEGTGQLSLGMWIRWDGGGGTYQGLIGKRNTWPATTPWQFQVRPENGGTFRIETGAVAIVSPSNTLNPLVGTWAHVAAVFDGTTARLYLNGAQVASGAFAFYAGGEDSQMGIGSVTGGGAGIDGYDQTFRGDMDEVCIFNRALSVEEVSLVMAGIGGDMASNPSPKDRATDVSCDVVLSWDPLDTATTRDVYLGASYDDVNDAGRANPGDFLVSQGQTDTTFETSGLEYGQTYYWRIDEVNGTPDATIFRGNIWSFTTEPYAYPISNITATASSFQPGMTPGRSVDGSGLNADDGHSTEMTQMWMSTMAKPIWIQYEFDKAYKLYELWVWNSNSMLESAMGMGAKDVTIEYSEDGSVWAQLEGVPQFARATGLANYAHNTTVNFGGVTAKYVKLTIESNWGGMTPQSGLSEVRFFYVPVQAREPQPADGATNVGVAADLVWRSGRETQSHDVYFGADADAVAAGTVPTATQTERTYTPESLEYGTTYYWRVDEVGQSNTYAGELWSFSTQEQAVFEGFEAYDDADNRVYDTWLDGWVNNSGSLVGYDEAASGTFGERTIVHSGGQSMPLRYDNTASPNYSETDREFETAQNWTSHGANALTLYFRGEACGFYEMAGGQYIMNAIGTDIWDTADQFRYVYKNLSGNATIVARIDSLVRSDAWAKAGVMIRESIHPGSKHAFVCLTPDYGASFQQRPETGNVMSQVSTNAVVSSLWVKLTRTGNAFTAQQSADGVTWSDVAFTTPVNITMASDVLIGLAVTSHNASVSTAAEFSNVSTTGNVTGQWQIAEIGVTQPVGNSVEPMYVRIVDSSGASATAVNSDAVATVRSTWQEWTIPYSSLAGVNLSRVKTMSIGVGKRTAPTAGGTGIVYIDDIALGRPLE